MFVNPFLNTTKTLLAPHLSADVAQSKAVSPAPRTMTLPWRRGRDEEEQEHIPVIKETRVTASHSLPHLVCLCYKLMEGNPLKYRIHYQT